MFVLLEGRLCVFVWLVVLVERSDVRRFVLSVLRRGVAAGHAPGQGWCVVSHDGVVVVFDVMFALWWHVHRACVGFVVLVHVAWCRVEDW